MFTEPSTALIEIIYQALAPDRNITTYNRRKKPFNRRVNILNTNHLLPAVVTPSYTPQTTSLATTSLENHSIVNPLSSNSSLTTKQPEVISEKREITSATPPPPSSSQVTFATVVQQSSTLHSDNALTVTSLPRPTASRKKFTPRSKHTHKALLAKHVNLQNLLQARIAQRKTIIPDNVSTQLNQKTNTEPGDNNIMTSSHIVPPSTCYRTEKFSKHYKKVLPTRRIKYLRQQERFARQQEKKEVLFKKLQAQKEAQEDFFDCSSASIISSTTPELTDDEFADCVEEINHFEEYITGIKKTQIDDALETIEKYNEEYLQLIQDDRRKLQLNILNESIDSLNIDTIQKFYRVCMSSLDTNVKKKLIQWYNQHQDESHAFIETLRQHLNIQKSPYTSAQKQLLNQQAAKLSTLSSTFTKQHVNAFSNLNKEALEILRSLHEAGATFSDIYMYWNNAVQKYPFEASTKSDDYAIPFLERESIFYLAQKPSMQTFRFSIIVSAERTQRNAKYEDVVAFPKLQKQFFQNAFSVLTNENIKIDNKLSLKKAQQFRQTVKDSWKIILCKDIWKILETLKKDNTSLSKDLHSHIQKLLNDPGIQEFHYFLIALNPTIWEEYKFTLKGLNKQQSTASSWCTLL